MSRLFFFLIVLLAISCHHPSKDEDSIFIILAQNIDQETANIIQRNEIIYAAYKYQLEDPKVKDKVAVWFPAVNNMHELSDSIAAEIKTIKSTINIKNEGGFRNKQLSSHLQNLYDSLILYQRAVLNIDPEIKKEFEKVSLISFSTEEPNTANFRTFEQAFTAVKSHVAYNSLLSVLENRIRRFENDLITYCYNKVTDHKGCFDEKDVPLLLQDKSIVAQQDSIEITGAIGEIAQGHNPEMIVMGQNIKAVDQGTMVYKLKTNETKGKHSIPVTIEFTGQNGIRKKASKTLYYIVR